MQYNKYLYNLTNAVTFTRDDRNFDIAVSNDSIYVITSFFADTTYAIRIYKCNIIFTKCIISTIQQNTDDIFQTSLKLLPFPKAVTQVHAFHTRSNSDNTIVGYT